MDDSFMQKVFVMSNPREEYNHVLDLLQQHHTWFQECIPLIASENIPSPAVREALILRATIAQPIPQVAGREERSEIFIHLNSVQRIEILHTTSRR